MNENYIVINGKKAELTREQLTALGIEKERENPFERTSNPCGEYFYTDAFGGVGVGSEEYSDVWKQLWNVGNYFNDKRFAKQVALHQLLYRKLLKFAYDNGYEDTQEWNKTNVHWCVLYNYNTNQFVTDCFGSYKYDGVWFSSVEGAERAIKEVVMPFVKEYPDFAW